MLHQMRIQKKCDNRLTRDLIVVCNFIYSGDVLWSSAAVYPWDTLSDSFVVDASTINLKDE